MFEGFDLGRGNEWLVALDVDYHGGVGAREGKGLAAAVGAAPVVGRGHYGAAAETLNLVEDALVVGGDNYLVKCLLCLCVNSLDHGFALDYGEGFARETGRRVTRGDTAYILFHCGNYKIF